MDAVVAHPVSERAHDPGQRRIGRFFANLPPSPLAIALSVVGTIVGLILLAWLVLFITKGRFLKEPFENYVGGQLQREVEVGGDFQLYFAPIELKFLAEDMTIANPEWASQDHLFSAALIDTRIATVPLIFGTRRIDWLELVDGDVDLEWDASGERNTWTFGPATGEPLEIPRIMRAAIRGSNLRYRDPSSGVGADLAFETVEATDSRFNSEIRFVGTGTARGEGFTLNGSLMSPNATFAGGRNQFRLHAEGVRTVMDVSGTLPGVTEVEGADLRAQVRGGNMADLFAFGGIAVPDTRTYRLQSALTKRGDEWLFTGLTGMFGESDVAGTLTVTMRQRLMLTADLRSDTVDIVDIGPFIGYSAARLEAQGNAGAIRMVNGTPRVLPDATLRTEALRRFDAHLTWRVRAVRAESLPISNISLTLDLDNSLLALNPFEFDVAGGHLWSNIQINARDPAVRTAYDIRLSPTPMARLLGRFGVEENGTTGTIAARAQLTGTGDTVHESLSTSNGRIAFVIPRGTMWARNTQLAELDLGRFVQLMFEDELEDPIQINCGLVAFTVRNGVGAADPILIDTRHNVMLGRGGFRFRDESLDLALRADGKGFSLFSAQSPIGINGYFARPGLDVISEELLLRAGAAIGLGVLVFPPAAILAFVDVGDAEAAACGHWHIVRELLR
ncbi:MAG: AsmA family protein, partial [Sphingomonadaceae bacterium]|nr:AsmA family protein [Sphingomonadaceae bacterium]